MENMDSTIIATSLPAIAAVHGVTFGGGLELALACDLIVADKSARFAFPELRLGLIPGFGGIPPGDRHERAVRRAVVDEQDLEIRRDAGQHLHEPVAEGIDIVRLAIDGHDDGELDLARSGG